MDAERARVGRKVIDTLIEMLPPSGAVFAVEDRKAWLDAMAATLVLIYGGDREVQTKIVDDEVQIDVIDLQKP